MTTRRGFLGALAAVLAAPLAAWAPKKPRVRQFDWYNPPVGVSVTGYKGVLQNRDGTHSLVVRNFSREERERFLRGTWSDSPTMDGALFVSRRFYTTDGHHFDQAF